MSLPTFLGIGVDGSTELTYKIEGLKSVLTTFDMRETPQAAKEIVASLITKLRGPLWTNVYGKCV